MADPRDDPGPSRDRAREVRPTWTAGEWSTVSDAAAGAGMAPASWASAVVVAGLGPETGRAPARCSRRPLLWGQVLERWQSVSWAMVALRGRVSDDQWAGVSAIVGRAGVAVTSQVEQLPGAERRHAVEACRVAATSMMSVGPGARPGARAARRADPAARGHRAKVLFPPAGHRRLRDACAGRGWNVSDYVAAVTTLTGWLARAGAGDPDELARLEALLAEARHTASHALGMLATPGAVDHAHWAHLAEQVNHSWDLLDTAPTWSGSRPPVPDPGGLVAQAFDSLGWAVPKGAGLP